MTTHANAILRAVQRIQLRGYGATVGEIADALGLESIAVGQGCISLMSAGHIAPADGRWYSTGVVGDALVNGRRVLVTQW